MALKQVKDYYKSVEKLYFDMLHSLEEMNEEFKKGNVTEEELNKLLTPVNNIKDNYLRLSYVLHLFYEPNRQKKVKKYEKQNHILTDKFKEMGVDKKSDLEESKYALKEFKKHLEEFKKENENGEK